MGWPLKKLEEASKGHLGMHSELEGMSKGQIKMNAEGVHPHNIYDKVNSEAKKHNEKMKL